MLYVDRKRTHGASCLGDGQSAAINHFIQTHRCTDVCVKLSLSNLQAEKILPPTDDVPPWTEQMVIEQKEEEAEAECDV